MDIEYVKRFIVVGQCLNFSKAAEQLFISQPTLSHSINSLEKKLGTPLLVRSTKSVRLTRAGELFLPAAVQMVELYENTLRTITEELQLDSGVLNIGCVGPSMDNMIAAWLSSFHKEHPNAKVQLLRYPSTNIADAFLGRSIQLGFLYETYASHIPGLKYQEVRRERFRLLVNADHPLAGQSSVDLAQLKDEPFVICERASSPFYYDRIQAICENRGFKPNLIQKVKLVSDIYRPVSAGLGVGILSYADTRFYDAYNIKFIDIEGDGEDLINRFLLAWIGQLSPLARQFRDLVKRELAR